MWMLTNFITNYFLTEPSPVCSNTRYKVNVFIIFKSTRSKKNKLQSLFSRSVKTERRAVGMAFSVDLLATDLLVIQQTISDHIFSFPKMFNYIILLLKWCNLSNNHLHVMKWMWTTMHKVGRCWASTTGFSKQQQFGYMLHLRQMTGKIYKHAQM